MTRALDLACLAIIVTFGVLAFAEPHFHSDSWTLYELSRTFGGDFWHQTTWRAFESETPYSTAFPPLYPLAIALSRRVLDVGIYTGTLLNLCLLGALLLVLRRFARTVALPEWGAPVLFAVAMSAPGLWDDAASARTMPLTLVIAVLFLDTFLRAVREPQPVLAAAVGLLAGLGVMTRFDFLPGAVAGGAVLAYLGRRRILTIAPAYAAGFLVVTWPWIAYSLAHHHRWWASDNVRTALLAQPSHVMMWLPDAASLPSISNTPVEWLKSFFGRKLVTVAAGLVRATLRNPAILVLGLAVLVSLRRGATVRGLVGRIPIELRWGVLIFAAQIAGIALTGYAVPRYYAPMLTYGAAILLVLLAIGGQASAEDEARVTRFARALVLVVALTMPLRLLVTDLFPGPVQGLARDVSSYPWSLAIRPEIRSAGPYEDLASALRRDSPAPRVLVMHEGSDLGRFAAPLPLPFVDPFRFGALTGIETLAQPSNLTASNLGAFLCAFHATHVWDPTGKAAEWLQASSTRASAIRDHLWRTEACH